MKSEIDRLKEKINEKKSIQNKIKECKEAYLSYAAQCLMGILACKEEIEELERELNEAESCQKEGTMYLAKGGWLFMYVKCIDGDRVVGSITEEGKCFILKNTGNREAYRIWVESGMQMDETPIEWSGGMYALSKEHKTLFREDMARGVIFDFEFAQYVKGCSDTNIQRYPNNDTPVGF